MTRPAIAIGILSFSLLGFEIVLFQIFALSQWYHFAFMAISVALLGFGASGPVLFRWRSVLLRNWPATLPALIIATGLAMALALPVSQTGLVRFDSYRVFLELPHTLSLGLTYLVLSTPFFLGALAIAVVFTIGREAVGVLYFANLTGSALGALAAVGLTWLMIPGQTASFFAALVFLSALVALPRSRRQWIVFSAGTLLSLLLVARPPSIVLSEYKDLSRVLDLPGARVIVMENSPFGMLHLVEADALRYAPGLSLTYRDNVPVRQGMFTNGDWFGPVLPPEETDPPALTDYTTMALPYEIRPVRSALILDAGTGSGVAQALGRDVSAITATEPNEAAVRLINKESTDGFFGGRNVTIRSIGARAFLESSSDHFSLISLPLLESFGGTGGAHALTEQWSLTTESFMLMWGHLDPNGMISVSIWLDTPLKGAFRLLATLVEVLVQAGTDDPAEHIAAVRSWGTVTFVVSRSPISSEEATKVRRFCNEMRFDPLLLPDLSGTEPQEFNRIADPLFFARIDSLLGPARPAIVETNTFDIAPTSDDRPYFFQFLRWDRLTSLFGLVELASVPFMELGYLIVLLTMAQIIPAAFLIIFLPLLRFRRRRGNRLFLLTYFGGLGLGFMFVEMMMIQRFTLYFGHSVYSSSVVIAGMLLWSGAGSYLSDRFVRTNRNLQILIAIVPMLILIAGWLVDSLIAQTVGIPFFAKTGLCLLFLGLPSLLMGTLFPSGLRLFAGKDGADVPWGWGINGVFSVIGTVGAVTLAVEIGFQGVMLCAAAFYAIAAVQVAVGRS